MFGGNEKPQESVKLPRNEKPLKRGNLQRRRQQVQRLRKQAQEKVLPRVLNEKGKVDEEKQSEGQKRFAAYGVLVGYLQIQIQIFLFYFKLVVAALMKKMLDSVTVHNSHQFHNLTLIHFLSFQFPCCFF